MIEFDVDMGYLLECDELDKVVLNDEDGEYEPMEFAPIAATVGRCDTMGLWPEWEQVLFANVSDEVAQDNLNECVHELLDKAATMGAGTCHIEVHVNLADTEGMGDVWLECDECHWQMPLEPTTQRFKYCPNCGKRIEVEDE